MSSFACSESTDAVNVELPPVHCRVVDTDGCKATVRYVGSVAGAKNKSETWLGVEWDDIGRGKHDGSSVDTSTGIVIRHFQCLPGQGSFIKPNKVQRGRPFIEALFDRYVSMDAPPVVKPDATLPDAFITTLKGNQKTIEFVGEENIRKHQQIENVKAVALRAADISSIGDNLGTVIAHLEDIDLQGNLLWEWREIALLGSQVPSLRSLLLHSNRMQPLTTEVLASFPPLFSFTSLRVLVLNSCAICSWAAVQLLEPSLPIVEELYLAHNQLTDLPRQLAEREYEAATSKKSTTGSYIVTGFGQLRLLDLTDCGLDEWSQVAALRKLPALQELILDQNSLLCNVMGPNSSNNSCSGSDSSSGSSSGDTIDANVEFPVLRRFSLSGTGLARWCDVDQLARYPQLEMLRLSQIPLFADKGSSQVRPQVISRIPQLDFFNGSKISVRERVEAEKSYLRDIVSENSQGDVVEVSTAAEEAARYFNSAASQKQLLDDCGSSGGSIIRSSCGEAKTHTLLLHPRYTELMEKYGSDLIPSTAITTSAPQNLAAELVTITFRNLSFGANGSLEPISKRIPRSLTVERLRLMVKQLFGLEPRMQDLSLRAVKDGSVPVLLDDDKSSLQYFGVLEGADIFINDAKTERSLE